MWHAFVYGSLGKLEYRSCVLFEVGASELAPLSKLTLTGINPPRLCV